MSRQISFHPNGTASHVAAALMTLLAASTLCPPLLAQQPERPTSIQELVAAQPRWDDLLGVTLRVEGHYTFFSATEIRFVNCDLRFLTVREFPRPTGHSKVIEVAGTLVKQKGETVFEVTSMRSRPVDLDVLHHQRGLLAANTPEGWYQLAEWARNRGEFYEDDELKQAADELFESGLAAARRQLPRDDIAGLRALANQALAMKIAPRSIEPLIHDALRAQWKHLQQPQRREVTALLDQIRRELPASQTPLQGDFEALQKQYRESPQTVYQAADEQTRERCQRLLYMDVLLEDIQRDAAPDGRNGEEIAARIERHLPELPPLIAEYREKELMYLSQHLESLSREQLVTFAARLEASGQTEEATQAKRTWLNNRHQQARTEGPRGLMELADETLNLLQGPEDAARLYIEAYELNPDLGIPKDWLTEHGYYLSGSAWVNSRSGRTADVDPLQRAIRDGQVKPGMTPQQVQAALGGEPSSIIRMASAGKVTEMWIYHAHRVAVQFSRSRKQQESHVVRVAGVQ